MRKSGIDEPFNPPEAEALLATVPTRRQAASASALAASPTPKDDTDRRIAALTEHFEAGRTVKAVDAALQAACASADEACWGAPSG